MKQILIAEDDRVLRRRIMKAIMRIGVTVAVHEAADTQEALDHLGQQPVDVVITDIRMPKGSGLMVLAYVNAFLPDVPCFVITAYGTSRLKDKMPIDLLHFYDKPFDVESLAIAVTTDLNRKKGADYCRGIQLPNFINLAAANGETATISISHPEHTPCKLYLRKGELVDAVSRFDRGEAVALAALAWDNPSYSIEFEIPDDLKPSISTPLSRLLRISCDCFDTT